MGKEKIEFLMMKDLKTIKCYYKTIESFDIQPRIRLLFCTVIGITHSLTY